MKILIVGGGAGSWEMRGRQLGAALGARVTSVPVDGDFLWCDVAIVVKRSIVEYGPRLRRLGVPVVWDALDFWRQPADNWFGREQAEAAARRVIDLARPLLVIGATHTMSHQIDGQYLTHHSRLGLVPTPARETVTTVAYDGEPAYLGTWAPRIVAECARRGWRFVVNPPDLSTADVLVSVRDGMYDGWICRQWKSGVKLVNAICAGRPILYHASAAAAELAPPGSPVTDAADLAQAFDDWAPIEARAAVVLDCQQRAPAFAVDAVAAEYQSILSLALSRVGVSL